MAEVSTLKEEKPENFIAAFGPQLNEVFSEILYCILIKYSRLNQRFVDVALFWTLWIVLIHAHFSASPTTKELESPRKMIQDQILSVARNKMQTANNHEKAYSGNSVTGPCLSHHNYESQTKAAEVSCKKKVSSGRETQITFGGTDT